MRLLPETESHRPIVRKLNIGSQKIPIFSPESHRPSPWFLRGRHVRIEIDKDLLQHRPGPESARSMIRRSRPTTSRQQSGSCYVGPAGLDLKHRNAPLRKRKIIVTSGKVSQHNISNNGTFPGGIAELADSCFCFRPQSGQFVYGPASHQNDRTEYDKDSACHEAFGVKVSGGAILDVRFWRVTRMSNRQRRQRIPKSLTSFPESTALTVGTSSKISLGKRNTSINSCVYHADAHRR